MKVKCCTQVFSQPVGKVMQFLIDSGWPILPKEASINSFDSCNGTRKFPQQGHELRSRISANSPHHDFWNESKIVLRSMTFKCKDSQKMSKPPSLANLIHIITGLNYLWKKLIEFFFCCIRICMP